MDALFDLKTYEETLEAVRNWLVENAVSLGLSGIAQILVVAIAFMIARRGAAQLQSSLERIA
jgi:hypothetical protein